MGVNVGFSITAQVMHAKHLNGVLRNVPVVEDAEVARNAGVSRTFPDRSTMQYDQKDK